ncbi:MAG: hypothetical protein QNK23_16405 [Crocinitomicaceae bacterium]|nr:hypothetical protein [Crocinitomicaceae bacterium]
MKIKILDIIDQVLAEEDLTKENRVALIEARKELSKSKRAKEIKSIGKRILFYQLYDYIKDRWEDFF